MNALVEAPSRRRPGPPPPRPPDPDPYLRRLAGALIVALLVHAVFMAGVESGWFRRWFPAPPPPPESSAPPVLTLVAPPEPPPDPAPAPPPDRRFLDTTDLPEAPKPDQSRFESAKNTALSAEQTGTSPELVPEQAGREGPGISLTDKAFSPETPAPPQPATPPTPDPEPPQPESAAAATPAESARETTPTETEGLSLSPRPQPEAPRAAESKPPPPPRAKPVPKPLSFSLERSRTAQSGGALPRGVNSLESEATPLGSYVDAIYQRIGFQWHSAWRNPFKKPAMSVISYGTVTLKFKISPAGRLTGVRVVSSSPGTSVLATVSMQAVQAAGPFPPFSEEVRAVAGDELELDCSFTLY